MQVNEQLHLASNVSLANAVVKLEGKTNRLTQSGKTLTQHVSKALVIEDEN